MRPNKINTYRGFYTKHVLGIQIMSCMTIIQYYDVYYI